MQTTGTPTRRHGHLAARHAAHRAPWQPAPQDARGRGSARPTPWLATSLVRAHARSRLEHQVRAIAVDALGRGQPGELPDDCTRWLAAAVDAAVTRVADASLAVLAETLDARLADAPPRVLQRIRQAETRHDAGLY